MKKDYTHDQVKDTGIAFTLLSLLIIYLTESYRWLPLTIVLLIIVMTKPALFKPFTKVWFGMSHAIGTVMSRIILTLIFFVVVTPVGIIRKMFGADSMQLKRWKKEDGSVFKIRNSKIGPKDMEFPY